MARFVRTALLGTLLVALLSANRAGAAPTRSVHVHDGGHFEVPDHPDFVPSTGMTMQAWVWRETPTSYQTILGKDANRSWWFGITPQGKVRFQPAGLATAVDSTGTVPLEHWTHITVTYDGSALRRYYLNGELNLESTDRPSPLVRTGAPLMIGADSTGFPFTGYFDELRFYSRPLTAAEVKASIEQEFTNYDSLESRWTCDRDNLQPLGLVDIYSSHEASGYVPFEFDALSPHTFQLFTPRTTRTIVVDGAYNAVEYGGAEQLVLDNKYFPPVHILQTPDNLYVCMPKIPRGASAQAKAIVLIDASGLGLDPLGPDHYRFTLRMDGTKLAEQGNKFGKFSNHSLSLGEFEAARSEDEFQWSAELRIRRTAIGLAQAWAPVRVAFAVLSIDGAGDAYFWPPLAEPSRPSTWAWTGFHTAPPAQFAFGFSGKVVDPSGAGLAGARLDFFASSSGLLTFLDSRTTGTDGAYRFTWTGQPPDSFQVMERDPPGTYSVGADPGQDGIAVSLNTLRYEALRLNHEYTAGTFRDVPGRPPSDFLDRHLLIVYPDGVHESDLAAFVDWKRRLGFQVETKSTGVIEGSMPGRDLAEKIRNWLRARWQALRPHPIYGILIGKGDAIPVRPIAWRYEDVRAIAGPTYKPKMPSDWYYADLDSDWDPDGDSLFGEGLSCGDEKQDCADEPERIELPRGTLPGPEDDWTAEIAIGRVGVNLPAEVRAALGSAMAAERSGSAVKRNALLAAAFWSWEGRSWVADPPPGEYVNLSYAWDGEKPFGFDSADHCEERLKPVLLPYCTNVRRLYEATSPDDRVDLIPTRQPFDLPLSRENVNRELSERGFGLVNLEGHGNSIGVYHESWVNDWNSNGRLDNPANPLEAGGACTNPCWELRGDRAFATKDMSDPMGVPPVVFANACGTGNVAWSISEEPQEDGRLSIVHNTYGPDAVAGRAPACGKAAAWIGALSAIPVSRMDHFNDEFMMDILSVPMTLGDAFWKEMTAVARLNTGFDWRYLVMDFFGDPSASYWGNPADLRSPWPQSGRDWRASSSTPQSGPSVGRLLWVTQESNILTPAIVETSAKVLVGRSSGFARFRTDGVLDDALGAFTSYPYPLALGTDGVYAVTGSILKDYDLSGVERHQVAALSPSGAVRIGPDGMVWVPTNFGMARRVGGRLERLPGGPANGPVAFTPEGHAVWSAGSTLWFYEIDRHGGARTRSYPYTSKLTAPAVGADGLVCIGLESGSLYGVRRETGEEWSYRTDGAVTARPTIGDFGRVFAATQDGEINCVSTEGEPVWTRLLGHAVEAEMATDGLHLYVAAGGFLMALHTSSGGIDWQVDLGGPTGPMSSPVISTGGVVYVLRADGRLAAVGEDRLHIAPENVLATAIAGGRFNVTWDNRSVGGTGFLVESCTAEGKCTEVGRAANGQGSLTVNGFAPGQAVYFRVRTLDADGSGAAVSGEAAGEYAYSTLVTALPSLPPAIQTLTANPDSAQSIRLTWQFQGDRSELLGFEVRRRDKSMDLPVAVGSADPGASELVDEGLEPGAKYAYGVYAFNAVGTAKLSPEASATTKTVTMARPSSFVAAAVDGGVRLSWKDNASGETGYVLERQVEGQASHALLATLAAGATSFLDDDTLAGSRLEYRVKAVGALTESPYAVASLFIGEPGPGEGAEFRRGDTNGDEAVDISDALAAFGFLFLGTAAPGCPDAMDSNDDDNLDIADGIFTLSYLFAAGGAPPTPGPSACGPDPTADALGECRSSCP